MIIINRLKIYGAPNANAKNPNQVVPTALSHEVMKVGTLLPSSANSADEVRGSMMLMKITPVAGKDSSTISLR